MEVEADKNVTKENLIELNEPNFEPGNFDNKSSPHGAKLVEANALDIINFVQSFSSLLGKIVNSESA